MKIVLCTFPIRWQPLTSDHADPAGLGECGAFGEVSGTMEKRFRLDQAIPSFTDQYADILPIRAGSCSQTSALPYKTVQRVSKTLLENKPAWGMDRLHLAQKILVQSPHSTQLKKMRPLPLKKSQASLIITAQQCETLASTALPSSMLWKKQPRAGCFQDSTKALLSRCCGGSFDSSPDRMDLLKILKVP